ncbi:hypothetical protein MVES1_003732 [Malassezia vespertilionis]|uniref:Uncharacterized protein n=1 Tax=Malassezia vespertilionis TaxID=2020962 RepID=A0A2N1J8B5_9BASI|nr:uncharacterized protein MVES1_003732 [Malassezia vespertilionis]PKI82795.1 hypothetical protein MVES_003290 [Malassezia vespertilionis]WFD08360.1 hypothetical protein MVES1_003732 [Malassezia vespertilionis]
MATISDWIGVIVIGALIYAIVTGVRHSNEAKEAVRQKKEELKAAGIDISTEGISLRSNRTAMDRDSYIQKTQEQLKQGGAYLYEHSNSMSFGKKAEDGAA